MPWCCPLNLADSHRFQHFRGNVGIILRPSPGLVEPDDVDQPSDEGLRTYWVFALVSQSTKAKEDGACVSACHLIMLRYWWNIDFEAKTAPPRWRVSLDENPVVKPTWEIVTVATSSINLVVNRVEKVRLSSGPHQPFLTTFPSQVDVNAVLDKSDPEAIDSTLSALQEIYDSLKSGDTIPEVEWTRMRQLDFQEALKARSSLAGRLKTMSCRLCADFAEHVGQTSFPPRVC